MKILTQTRTITRTGTRKRVIDISFLHNVADRRDLPCNFKRHNLYLIVIHHLFCSMICRTWQALGLASRSHHERVMRCIKTPFGIEHKDCPHVGPECEFFGVDTQIAAPGAPRCNAQVVWSSINTFGLRRQIVSESTRRDLANILRVGAPTRSS